MEQIQEARAALQEFLQESGKSQRQIAKEVGVSPAVISQFLNATYTGDNQEVAETVNKYLAVSKARLSDVQATRFYPDLRNTKDVLFACMYAHQHNDIALVAGDAGAGKTTALNHYRDNNAGVIMVTANACTPTATAVLRLVCEAIGKPSPGRKDKLMQLLVEHLRDTSRLIIVDEADHLSLGALQAVRNLNDLARVGIVLSGNDRIYLQMMSPRKGYEFDQIRTRIVVRKKVYNDYTPDEIAGVFPGHGEAETGYLLKLACTESMRTADKIYRVALRFAQRAGKPLSVSILRDTTKEMLGVSL